MKKLAGKKELINHVATYNGITKVEATKMVENVINSIHALIVKAGGVSVMSEFSIEVRNRAEKQGRNPATGESIIIPAHNVLAIKAGKHLNDDINA
jgi:DNA-binding protein HU-beta